MATKKKAAKKASPGKRGSRQGVAGVTVRTYRHGLGDCHLLALRGSDGSTRRMMIDCGLILGTSKAAELMAAVVEDIAADTDGHVDILVATHEHWDHVSGFLEARALFEGDTRKVRFDEVWMGWLDDRSDPAARRIENEKQKALARLAAFVAGRRTAIEAADPETPDGAALRTLIGGVDELLSFHGVRALGATEGNRGRSRQAMEIARSLGKPRYWRPSDKPWGMPGIRIYALGPPTDRDMIRKTASKVDGALYHFGGAMGAGAFFGAAQTTAGETDAPADADREEAWRFMPFDESEGLPFRNGAPGEAASPARLADATRTHLQAHYLDEKDGDGEDQKWRKIDDAWLDSAADFAIKLDNQTNNSSLVLAIELIESGKVLLFAADAQYGNWLSWQDTKWTLKDPDGDRTVTGPDLLRRTVFYKVGHHGSHNATARENGLESMTSDELVAIIPVDKDMAESKRWNEMPLPGLVTRLLEKTRGRLLRTDTDYAPTGTAESKTFEKALRTGPRNALTGAGLYYEIDVEG